MDKLDKMFEMQKGFMNALDLPSSIEIDSYKGQRLLRRTIFFMVQEFFEASQLLDYKPWKTQPRPTNQVKLKIEVIDALHFFLELCILLDIDASMLFKLYMGKMLINIKRQKEGY